MIENQIKYIFSTHLSKFGGYQAKNGKNGTITIFISSIYKSSMNFEDFVEWLDFYLIVERICLERAFQKIRMKNRCNPCKMERYAHVMKAWSE